jgi:hypothetical protein
MKLFPHEIVIEPNGRLNTTATILRYWMRFIPFWAGVAFGGLAIYLVMSAPK